jgi:ribosome-associated protein
MTVRKSSRPPAPRSEKPSALVRTITAALDDMKAVNVRVMDVRGVTDIADTMVIASGNSDRHVRSIADRVVERCKAAGFRPYGREGERDAEWVLVDLSDVIVHVMLPRVREFYGLEHLWERPVTKPVEAKAPVPKAPASRAPAKRPRGVKAKSPAKAPAKRSRKPAAKRRIPRA